MSALARIVKAVIGLWLVLTIAMTEATAEQADQTAQSATEDWVGSRF